MTAAPLFSVVIPVFNNWELTRNCLTSLREHTPGADYEVIVADNGSSDATAAELAPLGEALFGPRFTRLRFEENRNFGPACNAGARAATAPLLFLLNNDTLLTPGWSLPLLAAFEREPALGAAGPLLLYEDDTIQHLGVAFGLRSVGHLYRGFPKTHRVAAGTRTCQALTAAALMLPRALFLELGGFYDGFVNGFEDVDLCLRIGRLGKKQRCFPASVVYHLESRTQGRKTHETNNGRLLRERQGAFIVPDKHIHGLRDGFEAFISDAFEICLRLKPEEESRLLSQGGGNPTRIYELCTKNHFWLSGRELLVSLLRRQGQADMALIFQTEIVNIRSGAEDLKLLRQLGLEAGVMDDDDEVGKQASHVQGLLRDAERARSLLRAHSGKGDALLDSLLKQRCAFLDHERPADHEHPAAHEHSAAHEHPAD